MKFKEIREIAERISRDYHISIDDIEVEVSLAPIEENAEDGIRYFGDPHEAMGHQGMIMICVDGERNYPRK